MRSVFVLAVIVAVAYAKCCTTCTAPLKKYLSVDTTRNKCGEACINPNQYGLFHIFEKNLEPAESNTPCADLHFDVYDSTVTHGFSKLSVTLDLYDPNPNQTAVEAMATPSLGLGGKLAALGSWLVGNAPDAGYKCPGSSAKIHASCKQQANIDASCDVVAAEIKARVAGQYEWHDPHNNGTYTIIGGDDSTIELTRVTGNKKYTDKITISLSGSGNTCTLSGCSESQVMSVADFSTNFCNVRMLYCGTAEDCPVAATDLTYNVGDVKKSFGASAKIEDCLVKTA